jgi:hypothetical protein
MAEVGKLRGALTQEEDRERQYVLDLLEEKKQLLC